MGRESFADFAIPSAETRCDQVPDTAALQKRLPTPAREKLLRKFDHFHQAEPNDRGLRVGLLAVQPVGDARGERDNILIFQNEKRKKTPQDLLLKSIRKTGTNYSTPHSQPQMFLKNFEPSKRHKARCLSRRWSRWCGSPGMPRASWKSVRASRLWRLQRNHTNQIKQSSNQAIKQSIKQWVKQSINRWMDEAIK